MTDFALRLSWTERLQLAQRLLVSLHPLKEEAPQTVEKPDTRTSIKLPNPLPNLEAESIKLESISISFRKLRDALESSLE
ncbi:MAG: hypothetical protein KC800_19980 [Candidatus Eremiobacteraeota bacterium]|nr:hypothetical protein [Candidatus Eremiobacteraeota bacterium]